MIAKKPSSQEENDKFRGALEAAFEEVDTDNSGTLDLEELKAMPGFKKGAIVLLLIHWSAPYGCAPVVVMSLLSTHVLLLAL